MIRLFWIALLVIGLDQFTKQLALTRLAEGAPLAVAPFLNFTLTYNTGAAFGFLSNAGGWQHLLFVGIAVIVSIAIVVMVWRLERHELPLAVALMLILGGAVGNLLDRLRLGRVVDFIDVYFGSWHFYTFNIADAAITAGAVILLLDTLGVRLSARSSNETHSGS